MLDPNIIRNRLETVKYGLGNRGTDLALLDTFVRIDNEWRAAAQELEVLQQERNAKTPKGKPSDEERTLLAEISQKIKSLQGAVQDLESAQREAALQLPNVPLDATPIGKSEDDNVIVKTHGTPPSFAFTPKSHEVLGESAGLMSFDQATEIAGSRFVVMTGMGARLERAVTQLMLDIHTDRHGYTEVIPPALVNTNALIGTGQLPKFADDLYKIEGTDYWLSSTAEVQLTNLYRKSIMSPEDLPIKLTAATPCFRKEAGSYGKDIKGIIRLHQFHKVELVQVVSPTQSKEALAQLLADAETILQELELPYRVASLCTGDLGFASAQTFDLEVWFPSQDTYREISSCSNFLDFQARRAMIRVKGENGTEFAHTINGSGLAIGRTVAAIIENYQLADGSISIPKALRPYLGNKENLCQT
ncbi:MAG: serine--tRNA ligase [bacterium]|nr:serine--tRNA ligase [bacterium]